MAKLTLSNKLLRALASGTTTAVLISSGSAGAQPAAAPSRSGGIDEVLVTANRREEAIQTVPVAITAISADSLREQNITNSTDLIGKIPSLVVSGNGFLRSGETITIRGQGQTYGAPVGVVNYFAEVPLLQGSVASNQGGPGNFFDLESLQVLRGPQGTLFGRNTTGGALLMSPKKPSNQLEGYLQGQRGNYNDREVEGAINIPLIDNSLMLRIAVKKVDRDGFTKDVGPGAYGFNGVSTPDCPLSFGAGAGGCTPSAGFAGKDYDDKHYWTTRVGLLWRPVEQFENYLLLTSSASHSNGNGNVPGEINTSTCNLANLAANLAYGPQLPFTPDCGLGAGNAIASGTNSQQILDRQRQLGPRKVAYNTDEFEQVKYRSAVDIASWTFSENMTFRNILGYQRMEQNFAMDLDGSIVPVISQNPVYIDAAANALDPSLGSPGKRGKATDLSQLTVEPQLQGRLFGEKLDYVVGGFYSKTKPEGLQGQANFNAGSFGTGFFDTTTISKAMYAQGTLNLGLLTSSLDKFRVTAGVRRTWDTVEGSRSNPSFFLIPIASATVKSSPTTWTLGLDYQATDNLLMYGKATRGYKGGGFNSVGPREEALTFGPEYVTSYEIGGKSDFNIGSMPTRLNISGYVLDYSDIQRAIADSAPSPNPVTGLDQGAITFNADKAQVRGIEIEGVIKPTERLTISANYAFTEGEYKKFVFTTPAQPFYPGIRTYDTCKGPVAIPFSGPGVDVDLSCIPFPFVPKHQVNLNARYELPLGDKVGTLAGVVGYSWVDKQYQAPVQTPQSEPAAWIDSYGLVNASAEWNDMFGAPVDLRLFVTNATDKEYRISNGNGTSNVLGFSQSLYGEPRMYGASLRYRFQ